MAAPSRAPLSPGEPVGDPISLASAQIESGIGFWLGRAVRRFVQLAEIRLDDEGALLQDLLAIEILMHEPDDVVGAHRRNGDLDQGLPHFTRLERELDLDVSLGVPVGTG
jgi:hypothetical protein